MAPLLDPQPSPPRIEACVHNLFAEQVEAAPQAPAICAHDGDFTYDELDNASDRVAQKLVRMGVEAETAVLLCFEKSAWAVVAMLAVVKAGGMCVNLVPSYPRGRFLNVIDDCHAKIVLTNDSSIPLGAEDGLDILIIDEESVSKLALTDESTPKPAVDPSSAAYVLYTSGSTGKPKGIVVEHGSLCTSAWAHGSAWGIGPGTRVFQFAAYSFDVSVADNFFSVMRGACLCIPSEVERLEDPAGAVERMQANWAFLTPSVAATLKPSMMPSLRTLLLGGEAPTHDNVREWAPFVKLILCTGPAECSIYCAGSEPCTRSSEPSNIGKGIGGRLWVGNPDDPTQLMPTGEPGELLIEGRIVSRGYLNNPALTLEKFLVEPQWLTPETPTHPRRVYRTGDIVRQNGDGTFSFIGRRDDQVKIRGQRVELREIEGEIDAALNGRFKTKVLLAEHISTQGRLLVAFVVTHPEASDVEKAPEEGRIWLDSMSPALESDLKRAKGRLLQNLPSYMIPTFFIPIRQLPLTINGKADGEVLRRIVKELTLSEKLLFSLRSNMAAAENSQTEEGSSDEAAIQDRVRNIWAQVLGLEASTISGGSNFFDLGGDSLAAMQVVKMTRSAGIHLSYRHVMTADNLRSTCKPGLAVCPDRVPGGPPPHPDGPPGHAHQAQAQPTLKPKVAEALGLEPGSAVIEDVCHCTPAQQALITASLVRPGSHTLRNVYQLSPDADVDRFKQAWSCVYAGLPILRTRIVSLEAGQPLWQAVLRDELLWEDYESLEACFSAFAAAPAALGRRLMRLALVPGNATKSGCHLFVFSCNHALYDKFTYDKIMEAVSTAYRIDASPFPDHLDPPKSMAAFVHDLSNLKSDTESTENYWTRLFQDCTPQTWPGEAATEGTCTRDVVKTSMSLTSRSEWGSAANGFTLASVIQLAYGLLLSSYCGGRESVYGLTLSGRDAPVCDIWRVAGPTLATMPFRFTYNDLDTLQQLLSQVRQSSLDASQYMHADFHHIRQRNRHFARASTFQTILVVQPDQVSTNHGLGLDDPIDSHEDVLACPVVFECVPHVDGARLSFNLEFDRNVLGRAAAERLLAQLQLVTDQVLKADRTCRVSDVSLLCPEDHQILSITNSNQDFEPQNRCIHDLVKDQMWARPDSEAICSSSISLTYSELDRVSAAYATELLDNGLCHESVVPICSDKSPLVAIAALAVLRAGGAFLLLDDSIPQQRLLAMVKQVDAHLLIASEPNQGMFAAVCDTVLSLDRMGQRASQLPDQRLEALGISAQSLAYLVFTSGSTGTPKGIRIEHDSFATAFLARASQIRRSSDSRVYQFSSYAFDTCIEDIMGTWLVGGCVCIPSEHERKNDLAGSLGKLRANTADMTPSSSTLLSPETCPGLAVLILGGEAMTAAHVKKWSNKVCLINTYGPAECSVVTTVAEPAITNTYRFDVTNIGRPCCGRILVVDPRNIARRLPVGAPGELLVQGIALARGYLNALDDEKRSFVEMPDLGQQKVRFYRTGDIVRVNEDATISFCARRDTQVKIRGQRVELADIEASLASIDEVSAAAVEYMECQDSADKRLVTFLQLSTAADNEDGPSAPTVDFLKPITVSSRDSLISLSQKCGRILPSYMVPEIFIPVDALPMTLSGKLDRRTLRAKILDMTKKDLLPYRLNDEVTETEPPSTEDEILLQALWARVLDVESMTIHRKSNFFRLGGDSLSAIKLVTQCRAHGRAITVVDVFQHPRLESMALKIHSDPPLRFQDSIGPDGECASSLQNAQLSHSEKTKFVSEDPSLHDLASSLTGHHLIEEIENSYPCTPMQEGLMMVSARQPRAYFAQHVYQLPSTVDMSRFTQTWLEVARKAPLLRTAIVFIEGFGHRQVVLREPPAVEYSSEPLDVYLARSRARGLGYGDLLTKFGIVRQSAEQVYFILACHHSAFDGDSLRILTSYAEDIYLRREPRAPPLFDFRPFIAFLKESSSPSTVGNNFWKKYLDSYESQTFPLPLTRPRQAHREGYASHSFSIPGITSLEVTPTVLLRTAWALVVSHYSESNDVVIGSTLSGRSAPVVGIERLAAPTLTTVPVRVRFDRAASADALLRRMQSQAVEMMLHEQDGLQRIENLVPGSTNFGNIFVVHQSTASDGRSGSSPALMTPSANHERTPPGYHTHPLVVDCFLDCVSSSVLVEACFDVDSIPESQMQSMLRCLETVAKQFITVDSVSLAIRDMEFCSQGDLHMIQEWNKGLDLSSVEWTIPELILDRVKLQPDVIGVDAWDGKLTFAELDRQASLVAGFLAERGISARAVNRFVPICLEKSKFSVIAMLAVLKAGGAYVPLDPSFPPLRLQAMADQVHTDIALTDSKHCHIFGSRACVVDEALIESCDRDDRSKAASTAIVPAACPSDTAFLLFTSGSTGKPKAVMISHRSYCTLVLKQGPRVGLNEHSRVLQMASHAFDVSNNEILMTLALGGCVCMAQEDERFSDIHGVIDRFKVNWLFLTPTATAILDGPRSVPTLRILHLGGEAVRQDIVDKWAPHLHLMSTYGPAEGTIWASITHFTWPRPTSPLNIGHGDQCRLWLVDQVNPQRLAAIGAVGEILLEGPLVSDGYFEDKDRTEAVFMTEPAWMCRVHKEQPQAPGLRRVYRTGDTAKYNDDGTLTFCGRITSMVKLRGQRVDLGEIEHQLRRNTDPKAYSCVELLQNANGQDAIVAFLALGSSDGASLPSALIKQPDADVSHRLSSILTSLRQVLPRYMVPETIVPLTAMPRTTSGKTDRRKLRDMYSSSLVQDDMSDSTSSDAGCTITPPTQATQSTTDVSVSPPASAADLQDLRGLWAIVLQKDAGLIRGDSHFFELGGNSLSAIRLANLSRRHGIPVSVADIWTHPVFADLERTVPCVPTPPHRQGRNGQPPDHQPFTTLAVAIQPRLDQLAKSLGMFTLQDAFPCSPIQESLMYLSMEQQGAFVADFHFVLPLRVDLARFMRSWQSTHDNFDNLRTRIVDEPYLGSVQLISKPHPIEWLDETGRPSPDRAFTHGRPLCRFSISNPAADKGPIFTITMHHAVFDGHTLHHMLRFARAAYDGHSGLVPRPLSHGIFVRSVMDVQRLVQGRAFWKSHLYGLQAKAFPASSSTTTALASRIQRHRIKRSCSVRTNGSLDVTLAVQIQAAWGLLLSFYTGSSDVLFGYTVSGRDSSLPGVDVDVDDIAGPTVTTLARRLVIEPTLTVKQYLARVAQTTAATIPHQHLGMHQITQAAGIVAPRSRLQVDHKRDPSEDWLPQFDTKDDLDYLTDPLFVQCSIEDAGHATSDAVRLILSVDFDSTSLLKDKAGLLLSHFEQVIVQLSVADSSLGHISLSQSLNQTISPVSDPMVVEAGDHVRSLDRAESRDSQKQARPSVEEEVDLNGASAGCGDLLTKLRALAARAMRVADADVDVDLPWIILGGDSISAMRMAAACRSASCQVSVAEILNCDSLVHLALLVSRRRTTATRSGQAQTPNGPSCAPQRIPQELRSRLSESECFSPRLPQKDGVVCVGDATWMQHLMFSPVKSEGRGWNNILILDLEDKIELDDIEKGLADLVANTDILRSVFSELDGQLRIAILESVPLMMERLLALDDLNKATEQWIEAELARPSTLLDGAVRGALLQSAKGETRMALNLHHCRYDGVSLPLLYNDLLLACKGQALPARPSFMEYAAKVAEQNSSKAALDSWKLVLAGSHMTRISASQSTPSAVQQLGSPISGCLTKTITASVPQGSRFTFATFLKAAWSMLLSTWAKSPDVVFGHLVSGRAIDMDGIDEIIGPCLNIVPVRARVDIESPRGIDVLQQIHQQSVRAMNYEAVSLANISRHCGWQAATIRFTSVVQHQNMDDTDSLMRNASQSKVRLVCPDLEGPDLWFISIPQGKDKILLELDYVPTCLSEDAATTLLDLFAQTLSSLCSTPQGLMIDLVPSLSNLPALPL